MGFKLSLSTNPLVNRFADPAALIDVLGQDIGIGHVQLTHEFINPAWPAPILARTVSALQKACAKNRVTISSTMTGPYGRLNHFGHPDADIRAYYVQWFKTLAELSADLGAQSTGTQFAILTYRDHDDPARRRAIMQQALDCWREVAEHAAHVGLRYLFWEPMSVGRELGHTLAATQELQDWIDAGRLAVPLRPMVDIDHGDVASPDAADTDPYAWASTFARQSPIIHIKQSSLNKGGHWPFTRAYNADGRIVPDRLLAAVQAGGGTDNELCLELAFREREPADRSVVAAIRESVEYWRPYCDTGFNNVVA